jgi:hypothetical protein
VCVSSVSPLGQRIAPESCRSGTRGAVVSGVRTSSCYRRDTSRRRSAPQQRRKPFCRLTSHAGVKGLQTVSVIVVLLPQRPDRPEHLAGELAGEPLLVPIGAGSPGVGGQPDPGAWWCAAPRLRRSGRRTFRRFACAGWSSLQARGSCSTDGVTLGPTLSACDQVSSPRRDCSAHCGRWTHVVAKRKETPCSR